MRAREIVNEDLVEPEVVDRPVSTPFNIKKMGQRSRKSSGGGAYAAGIEDPTDPSMYRKKSRMPSLLEKDAYYQFIKAAQPYVDYNPFLPRVYKIIVKKDPRGFLKPEYHMEKLTPYNEAWRMYDQDGNSLNKILKRKLFTKEAVGGDVPRLLANSLEFPFQADTYIKDPKLIQALDLIRTVKETNSNFMYDLHEGNMMFRIGTTGPQLVITDPLADKGASIVGYNPFSGKSAPPSGVDPN